ncbi:hypothetical protein K504DRAFT_450434 [Pleomassaria siparia CBS 279.74]|uniref:Uncharacterized protein n=1 Tax=Pleomassaria siparia CBS 279.74 TaxID=1314801 RepID=A0A6G1KLS5_9PLEO|nr:hypothetical protein K504DRAFT_450434 [Pleomassaria siparia CBS 279.74]
MRLRFQREAPSNGGKYNLPSKAANSSRLIEYGYLGFHVWASVLYENASIWVKEILKIIFETLSVCHAWPGNKCYQLDLLRNPMITNPECNLLYSDVDYSYHDLRTSKPSTLANTQLALIRRPPRCRLAMSMRLTTLILYLTSILLLSSSVIAAPILARDSQNRSSQINPRQAIPDKNGNTGTFHLVPCEPQPTSTVTPTPPGPSFTNTAPSSPPPQSQPRPSSPVPGGDEGKTNNPPPGQLGTNTNAPPEALALSRPNLSLTTGAIAGIAGGAAVFFAFLIALGVCAYRRRKVDVNEIPIRRSKLVSRLGFRVFGDKPPSRRPSRRMSRDSQGSSGSADSKASKKSWLRKDKKNSWLDKTTIGRPKPAWSESGLLDVPKPLFIRRDGNEGEDEEKAPWVDKGLIGRPKPGRPRSAEPLGRLSGMGLGMGYLK